MLKIINEDTFVDYIYNIVLKNNYITISKDNIIKYINDKYHKVVVKLDSNNSIVGFTIYFILYPEIDILFIATYPNNNGYGREMIDYIFNDAKKNKISSIKLELDITNIKALNFYKKNGFTEVAIRKKYYNNKSDAIIMEKTFIY